MTKHSSDMKTRHQKTHTVRLRRKPEDESKNTEEKALHRKLRELPIPKAHAVKSWVLKAQRFAEISAYSSTMRRDKIREKGPEHAHARLMAGNVWMLISPSILHDFQREKWKVERETCHVCAQRSGNFNETDVAKCPCINGKRQTDTCDGPQ